jgi:hypothetical protein
LKTEFQRMKEDASNEKYDGPSIVIIAKASNGSECLRRVKEVIELIAEESANGTWPTDDVWSSRLPSWFTDPFHERTLEQVLADKTLWDYGSWLDAMRHRGWQWWSSASEGDTWSATLLREDEVYSIEPLIYLARQSGASTVEVLET